MASHAQSRIEMMASASSNTMRLSRLGASIEAQDAGVEPRPDPIPGRPTAPASGNTTCWAASSRSTKWLLDRRIEGFCALQRGDVSFRMMLVRTASRESDPQLPWIVVSATCLAPPSAHSERSPSTCARRQGITRVTRWDVRDRGRVPPADAPSPGLGEGCARVPVPGGCARERGWKAGVPSSLPDAGSA